MVSLFAMAAKTSRPRGRPRARWVEYRTYSCALFVRDGPIYPILSGWRRRHPDAFFSFLYFLLCDRRGRSLLWGFYRWG